MEGSGSGEVGEGEDGVEGQEFKMAEELNY